MTPVYLDSHTVEVNLGGVWTDISPNVVGNFKANWGIPNNNPNDRVATIGTLAFTLNNASKQYTPGSPTADPNWVRGAVVRLVLTYDGLTFTKFRGYIDEIVPTSGEYGERQARVTCSDWMEMASTFPLILAQSSDNKRADEGISLILAQMPVPPQSTLLSQGDETLNSIFDIVQKNTTALSEFAKLVMSEYGYLYLRHDGDYGETLVFEAKHDRDGYSLSQIPNTTLDSGKLLLETGDSLLLETGDRLVLNEFVDISFDNLMTNLDADYGQGIFNRVTVKVYPRLVGGSVAVLFSLNSPIPLAAGEIKSDIRGIYIDPTAGGTNINGKNMVAPSGTLDYLMNSAQDSSGTDLTANLIVTGTYGTESVVYTLKNNGVSTGYVTKLQARGYPVYIYNFVEQTVEDDASILQNGYQALTIEQKYSGYTVPNVALAQTVLASAKDAQLVGNHVDFIANTSHQLMKAFLFFDIGDKLNLSESQTALNGDFSIQSVSCEITPSGIIYYTWGLKNIASLSAVYWELETAGRSELGLTTFVGY